MGWQEIALFALAGGFLVLWLFFLRRAGAGG